MKKILVADYPSAFTFPNGSYGSAEKRIWTVAKYSHDLGMEVIISGPLWKNETLPMIKHFRERLNKATAEKFVNIFGKVDYLFVGHEYFKDPEWDVISEKVSHQTLSFQGNNCQYNRLAYNGVNRHLFCNSDEMMEIYKEQNPQKTPAVYHSPYEIPNPQQDAGYLVWCGRMDDQKAPHYAAEASRKLKKTIVFIGAPLYQKHYLDEHFKYFDHKLVYLAGTINGQAKMNILGKASCMIYTCAPNWIEAAGAVFTESFFSGVPIAGMTWKGNDSVAEALSSGGGSIVKVSNGMSLDEISDEICSAVEKCIKINHLEVLEYAKNRFDPIKNIQGMFDKIENKTI